jgi:hypothetical protein
VPLELGAEIQVDFSLGSFTIRSRGAVDRWSAGLALRTPFLLIEVAGQVLDGHKTAAQLQARTSHRRVFYSGVLKALAGEPGAR